MYIQATVRRRSLQMEMHINSPHVKVLPETDKTGTRSLPIFSDHDRIGGQVVLDPSCSQSGRLTVSIEGTFSYTPEASSSGERRHVSSPRMQRHTFFSSATVIPITPADSGTTMSSLRESLQRVRRPSLTKKPSLQSLKSAAPSPQSPRFYSFGFDLPRSYKKGEELPPTFSSKACAESDRGRPIVDSTEIEYKVTALWEASDGAENRGILEAPILIQTDPDFQSLDASSQKPEAWLEMPLKSDRPIPFKCAITLPSTVVFSRSNAIPYFVVFTTHPRSSSLAREIASDATVAVTLLRQVTLSVPAEAPPTPPQTPPSSGRESEEFEVPAPLLRSRTSRTKLLDRVVRSASPILSRGPRTPDARTADDEFFPRTKNKPLPPLPIASFSETRTLLTDVCIGFPKRPRRGGSDDSHASVQDQLSLPDGLYKGRVQLNKSMIRAIDWPGVRVKYYLDVSVLFGQDDLRARIPIQII
ncbi:hypothetical protein PLICRDRAFT_642508 [Plicaturopsis crispa FD-325 SS-3]|nr:hypothetical protein PLICRDRAFT_642508 [Plicaturopsis crispa FD-325 SS-3]